MVNFVNNEGGRQLQKSNITSYSSVATDQWDSCESLYFLYLSSRLTFLILFPRSENLSHIYILFTMFSKVQI